MPPTHDNADAPTNAQAEPKSATAELAHERSGDATRPVAAGPTNERNFTVGVWLGLLIVVAGFLAVFFTWGRVAGLTRVAQQLPYVVSGGITGIGLVIVGVLVVDLSARRQDTQQKLRLQRQTLGELIVLRRLLEERHESDV